MTICSWSIALNCQGWKAEPNCRYVMSDSMFRSINDSLAAQNIQPPVASWSCHNSWNWPYGGHDLNGRTLLIYRENGFGDNLMITGFVGYLRSLYPQATIHTYGMPRVGAAWAGNTDANFLDVLPSFDAVRKADYHLFLEGFIENNNEPEQFNCYDQLLRMCSINPKAVPNRYKRPQIFWTEPDQQMENEWRQLRPKRDYVLWHWNPSGRVRQYPFAQAREAIGLLAEQFDVVVAGDTQGGVEPLNMDQPHVHNWLDRTPNIHSLLPMIKHAKAVVCPDSSVLHLAASFNGGDELSPFVPVVGLWGPFDPKDRAQYYSNHFPLEAFHVCPSAPCRTQKSDLPVPKCQQAQGWAEGETLCRAMAGISAERIRDKVVQVTR